MEALPAPGNAIDSKWHAFSVTTGLALPVRVGNNLTVTPALDLGLARLDNHASYGANVIALQPILDGRLFNWHTDATVVTPSIEIAWHNDDQVQHWQLSGQLARSWISSFDESNALINFNETANVFNLHAERAAPLNAALAGHSLDWVCFGSYSGFIGADRSTLGLGNVAELGLALQTPWSTAQPDGKHVRLSASYLFGPNGRGWSIGAGMDF